MKIFLSLLIKGWNSKEKFRRNLYRTFCCSLIKKTNFGNITNVLRSGFGTGAALSMDSLHYYYNPLTNQLNHIHDDYTPTLSGNYADDLETQATGNYGYDAIGNMVADASEEISSIKYTTYQKVGRVNRTGGSTKKNLRFRYGPTGERWVKMVYNADTTQLADSTKFTYYVRDAAGNIMATYDRTLHDQHQLKPSKYGKYDSCIRNRLGTTEYATFIGTSYSGTGMISYIRDSFIGTANMTIVLTHYMPGYFPGGLSDADKYDYVKTNDPVNFVKYNIQSFPFMAFNWLRTHISITSYKTTFETAYGSNPGIIADVWGCVNGTAYKISESISLSEWDIYGSKRLGVLNDTTVLQKTDYDGPVFYGLDSVSMTSRIVRYSKGSLNKNYYYRYLGMKSYELTNHLGNVLTTLIDRKIDSTYSSGLVTSYTSDIRSATDYYAFGWEKPGRNFSADNYRNGFNGKENDKETGHQDYGMRMYDKRIGRFFGVDPITKKYPELTPYQFASNMPIIAIDLDGLEASIAIAGQGNGVHYTQDNNNDNNYFPQVANGMKSAGFIPFKVNSGKNLLNTLVQVTKDYGTIQKIVSFTHGTPFGVMFNDDNGFYNDEEGYGGKNEAFVSDFAKYINKGDIKFEKNATWIIAGCKTGMTRLHGETSLSEALTSKTGITTIGATDRVNILKDGKITTLGKFIKYTKSYDVTYSRGDEKYTYSYTSSKRRDQSVKDFNYDNAYKVQKSESVKKEDLGNTNDTKKTN